MIYSIYKTWIQDFILKKQASDHLNKQSSYTGLVLACLLWLAKLIMWLDKKIYVVLMIYKYSGEPYYTYWLLMELLYSKRKINNIHNTSRKMKL